MHRRLQSQQLITVALYADYVVEELKNEIRERNRQLRFIKQRNMLPGRPKAVLIPRSVTNRPNMLLRGGKLSLSGAWPKMTRISTLPLLTT